jgi:hypothetical protein
MAVVKKSKKSASYLWIITALIIVALSVFLLTQRLWKDNPQASGLYHYSTITKIRVATNNCNPKIKQYALVITYANSKNATEIIGLDSFTVTKAVTTGMYLTELDSSSNVIVTPIYDITAFDTNGNQIGELKTITGNANSPIVPGTQPTVYLTVPCNF